MPPTGTPVGLAVGSCPPQKMPGVSQCYCHTIEPVVNRIRISIIIPAYNEVRTLPACLDAIARQSVAPHEVIVVDNNSSDRTAAIAHNYPFVKVVHESRQGVVFARNTGFNTARGSVLARIDADTRVPSDWVETIRRFYREPGRDSMIFTGGCRFYNLRSGYLTGRMYDLIVHRLNRLLLGYYFPWGSNSALPAAAWRAVRGRVLLANGVHEDLDLGIQLHRAGYITNYISHVRVSAMAKRILSGRSELWPYAAMWPRTYRQNHLRVWPFVWPLAVLVWLGSYGIFITEAGINLFLRTSDSGNA